jgi:hypothetical protein
LVLFYKKELLPFFGYLSAFGKFSEPLIPTPKNFNTDPGIQAWRQRNGRQAETNGKKPCTLLAP